MFVAVLVAWMQCRRNAISRQDLRCLNRGMKIATRIRRRKSVPPIAPPMIAALEWGVGFVSVEDIGMGVFDCVAIVAGFDGKDVEGQRPN